MTFSNFFMLSKTFILTALVNSIALSYLYYTKKKAIDINKGKKEKNNDSSFKQLIDGNNKHQYTRKKPIAIVIAQPNINVEEIFQMFNNELFIIRNTPETTEYDIAGQIEYAIKELGIDTIFTLVHPNDSSILNYTTLHDDDKFEKKLKYSLQRVSKILMENIMEILNLENYKQLKLYYSIYEQKSGNVIFYHFQPSENNEEKHLKESFIIHDDISQNESILSTLSTLSTK